MRRNCFGKMIKREKKIPVNQYTAGRKLSVCFAGAACKRNREINRKSVFRDAKSNKLNLKKKNRPAYYTVKTNRLVFFSVRSEFKVRGMSERPCSSVSKNTLKITTHLCVPSRHDRREIDPASIAGSIQDDNIRRP